MARVGYVIWIGLNIYNSMYGAGYKLEKYKESAMI